LRTRRFDLIHAHWTLPQGLLAATLPDRLRVPFITTAHGGDVYTLARGPLKTLLRLVLKRAAAVTAVSNELYETLLQLADTTPVVERIHRIPMGVDAQHFARVAAEAKRPKDMPDQGQVILFVGRLAEKKGVHVLIDALAHGLPELASAKAVVVGEGPQKAELIAHAAARRIAHRVDFLGARSHADLPAYLAAADVFALPSVQADDGDKDGLPVTLMEAAACGVPAVASDIGGVPEFIVHARNGLLVPPGEPKALAAALGSILSDPDMRMTLGTSAVTTAQEFDWSTIANRYASVLSALLEGTKDQPVAAP
jgi:glycosyltransferase involved in cell wall biosynthesis